MLEAETQSLAEWYQEFMSRPSQTRLQALDTSIKHRARNASKYRSQPTEADKRTICWVCGVRRVSQGTGMSASYARRHKLCQRCYRSGNRLFSC